MLHCTSRNFPLSSHTFPDVHFLLTSHQKKGITVVSLHSRFATSRFATRIKSFRYTHKAMNVYCEQHSELLYWTPNGQFKSKMNLPLEKVSKIEPFDSEFKDLNQFKDVNKYW